MTFLTWFLEHFGFFFGPVFLVYLFLMIRRLTVLYDFLRHVPAGENETNLIVGDNPALSFLYPFFKKLKAARGTPHTEFRSSGRLIVADQADRPLRRQPFDLILGIAEVLEDLAALSAEPLRWQA
ncbi:MAG: hypothetical protein MI802_05475, partial [Desulfobacterales bacterium]|nr:hypothetical protein [Desulfobacterales bacterium]